MKETVSTCEKNFIIKGISEGKRLDGRSIAEFRNIRINYGSEWGSAHVSLGETKVLAQVSCDVTQPKSTRANEGLLHINVELGPMAAQSFEAGRPSEMSVHVNRILERALKDSRAIDLESLCIVADEKVWNLRVDVNVLNHEGNIIDCASVAALAALAHFKRPDVTTTGDEFIIHTHAERDPIPITLHHYPVCVSFGIFGDGLIAVADPTVAEERISEASMVFGLNSYRELCGLHLGGTTLTNAELLLQCAKKGAKRAKTVVDAIKESLVLDEKLRSEGKPLGFTECIRLNEISSLLEDRLHIKLRRFEMSTCTEFTAHKKKIIDDDGAEAEVQKLNDKSAVLVPVETKGTKSRQWIPDSSNNSDEDMEDDDHEMAEEMPQLPEPPAPVKEKKRKSKKPKVEVESDDGGSEEDATVVLT